jgi:trimeric autotransporter adhesin
LENVISGAIINANTVYACTRGIEVVNYDALIGTNCGGRISNNVLYGLGSAGVDGYGIKSASSKGWDVYHNTWAKGGGTNPKFTHLGGTLAGMTNADWVFRNNIAYDSTAAARIFSFGSSAEDDSTPNYLQIITDSDYNDIIAPSGKIAEFQHNWHGHTFAQWQAENGVDAHSLNTDPKFTSYAGNDYTLAADSPCKTAGTPVSILTDRLGKARSATTPSMGAYEYAA